MPDIRLNVGKYLPETKLLRALAKHAFYCKQIVVKILINHATNRSAHYKKYLAATNHIYCNKILKAHVKVKCTSQSQRSLEQLLPGSSHFSRAMYEEDPGDEVGH